MTDSIQQSDKASLTARLKELLSDISPFIDNAPEDQKRKLLGMLEDLRKTDRRKHSRKACSIAVDCSAWGDALKGIVKDISAGGMFILSIETDMVLSVGQQITVSFPTLPNKQESIELPGEVTWTVPEGIGVKFTTVSPDLEAMIKAL